MFSPLNDPHIEDWFQRLNAPLKRLPADERTQLHLEVRQHLDALAAANAELGSSPDEARRFALEQFGDPSRFGKKMVQEWQAGKGGFRADLTAVLLGAGLQIIGMGVVYTLDCLWEGVFYNPGDKVYHHVQASYAVVTLVSNILLYGTVVGVSTLMGRKHPYKALKSAFYAFVPYIALAAWALWMRVVAPSDTDTNLVQKLTDVASFLMLTATASIPSAYFASVTKRGWYRPTWEDFKITLPRRWQIAK